MSNQKTSEHTLELDEDMAFQQRTWRMQRIAWIALVALMLAALLGLFSRGPFSSSRKINPDGLLAVEYQRFERYTARSDLVIEIQPQALSGGEFNIQVDQALLEFWQLQSLVPTPQRSAFAAGGISWTFRVAESTQATRIVLAIAPARIGWVEGNITLAGHPPLRLAQFVFP